MTDEQHDRAVEDFATVKADVKHIKEAVDEIKPFCKVVTQHEEKIDTLEKVFSYAGWVGGMVMLALIAAVLAHFFAK